MIGSYFFGLASNYLNQLLSVLVNLILIPYLLTRMGTRMTGVYLVLMTVANFAAVGVGWVAGAGVTRMAMLDVTRDRELIGRIHRLVVLAFGIYGTAVLAVTALASLLVGRWWLTDASVESIEQIRRACLLLGVYVWISYVHNADLALLTALLRQGEANLYRAGAQALFGVAAIGLLAHGARIDVLLAAQVLATLAVATAVRISLRFRSIISRWEWTWPDKIVVAQVLVATGGSYFLFGIAQFALMYADVFVVGAVLGSEAVTAYIVVWKIAEFSGLVISRISETLSPYLTRIGAHGSVSELRALFLTTSRLQHGLAIAVGCGYALIGPWLVGLWVGVENRPTQWWLYALCGGGIVFQVVNRHDVILHFALERIGRLVVPHIVEVALKLGLTVVFFPALGFGAPLAAFAVVQVFGMTWWYRRAALQLVRIGWREWWQKVAGPVSVEFGLIVACVVAVAPWATTWSWGMSVVSGCVLTMALGLVAHRQWRQGAGGSFASVTCLLSKY